MQKTLTLFLAFNAILAGSARAGDKYVGKWNDGARTTLEIMSSTPLRVRYCYRTQCGIHNPAGSIDKMMFKFAKRGTFAGANMTMTKAGSGYSGEYQRLDSTQVFTATLNK